MKFLNKVLCLMAFFAIGSVSAKRMGAARPAAPGKPAPVPGKPAEESAQKSFKQLRDQVLGMRQSDVMKRYLLSNDFIQKMKSEMSKKVATLFIGETEKMELELLLKTARDKFLQFTGDDKKDLTILANINTQIEKEVNNFK